MRIAITSLLFLSLLSCKKDHQPPSDKTPVDTAATVSAKTDTLKSNSAPKEELFHFVTDLCDNKGYFDSNIYSRAEIEGTYKLWLELGGILLDTPSVFNLRDLQEIRQDKDQILAKLDKDFAEKKKMLQDLTVVNTPYWQNVKKVQSEALAQRYEMEKIRIAAYSDPSVLLKSNTCQNFTKALNSTDEQMMEEWKKLREQINKNNADPEGKAAEFNSRLNSPDRKDYATIDLITFGWGNCSNDKIKRVEHDARMNKEFYSLFLKTDSECDEP
ncbi:hypothetical protein [Chryseobacterium sp. 22458]|uniref:hypothetical protein n=1 Tax=Chryseobacterium sp. 22458 TaxID=3453921 RepID=UPI003F8586B0